VPADLTGVSSGGSPDVVVVGGGAIGACTALELAARGVRVTLLERGEGVGLGCSLGNAGLIRTDHLHPLATPRAVLEGIWSMFDPAGPFAFRPRPALLPWMARFMVAARPSQVRQHEAVLRGLGQLSRIVHADYLDHGMDTGLQRNGVMDLFESEEGLAAGMREAGHAAADGRPNQVLSAAEVKRLLPALRSEVAGGVVYTNEWFCDPLQFTTAVAAAAQEKGAAIRTAVEVKALKAAGGRVVGVETSAGDLACGSVVLAAGVWSKALAGPLGVKLPVESGKGYHLEFARTPDDPELPFIMHEAHVAVTPLAGALRFAGTLELSGIDERISERRVGAIRAVADRLFGQTSRSAVTRVWSGLRPCSPDGLPMLGPTRRVENLFVATGHGMQGIVLAAGSGRALAEAITGRAPSVSLEAMSPDRF
jgi:D-amino-acid dehydrogenase